MWKASIVLVAACGGSSAVAPDGGGGDAGTDAPGDSALEWDVPLETWTWVDVPGMVCGNGSPTGIAINPTTRSQKLVLMFEGGGACWEAANCYGIVIPVTASHLDGFDATTFDQVRADYFDNVFAFQRDEPTSTFGDASWVFVPYCTGDIHAGTRENVYMALGQQRTMHHKGGLNVDLMLARVSGYPAEPLFAMGVSAGGFGAALNWDRIAAAFPQTTTHLLADGSQMVPVESGRWGTMNTAWGMRFPDGCVDCAANMANVAAHWRAGHPATGGRFALLSSLQDQTLSLFFGYTAQDMKTASLAIGNAMTGNEAAFMIDDDSHTLLDTPQATTSTNMNLVPFVAAWAGGGFEFVTAGP